MDVQNIKTASEVMNLCGADLRNLQTAIESHPEGFSQDVKNMMFKRLHLIRRYGIDAEQHTSE